MGEGQLACWSAVHGFAVLNVEGPLRGLPAAERQRALEGLLLSTDRGLGIGHDWPALTVP
ncbi:hypothetical protein ASG76_14120 [Nocardioides sp. Soil774]|uniref:hypothetical protein n=1 Tax=Nocardioides sp. Soil774 TaxID=1736408 RepID=UPI0006F79102|nr:hypothetical protein [Nocardioides sp. Soil774]KRE93578.1 hypothetical protein ASG76_14120 [Nocardioides sp. Soil774]